VARKRKPRVCLCGECGGKVHARGLSRGCYQALCRMVRSKLATWAALEEAGHALPATPRSQRRQSPARRKAEKLIAKAS
jgi:hypothetical protein